MAGKLTAVGAKALVGKGRPGAHADGGGLYLRISGPGAGKWTLRYQRAGRAREMGLGGFADVSLADARDAAAAARRVLRDGADPIADRRAREAAAKGAGHTFSDVAALYIEAHRASWRNEKHAAQWQSTLETYAAP